MTKIPKESSATGFEEFSGPISQRIHTILKNHSLAGTWKTKNLLQNSY